MVWRVTDPQCNESGKIKWEIVQYTRGRGLDLGCGLQKLYPHFIGVDNRKDAALFGHPINPDIYVDTAERMEFFASGSLDFIFSSHLLEHIDPERVTGALKEWMRIIKHKGYLVLYLPDEDEYPKVGENGANPDHKWNVNYGRVIDYMRASGSWDLIDFQKRNEDREYSLYFVFQKVGSGQHESWKKKVKPDKSCAVVRYGAYGDLIQASSVFAGLKAQGYQVTLYTSPPGDDVVRYDPNIDVFYYQDKDQVPNHLLGEYWSYHKKKFDKWVNLSESVEGTFLALPGRTLHNWSPKLRHSIMNKNYLEVQHDIAGVPHKPQIHFFATEEEKTWAKKQRAKMGDFLICWPLAGSSVHKTPHPNLDNIIASIMLDFPRVHICLMGAESSKIFEQGWENEKKVHRSSGQWSMRQSMTFMSQADMAIGPETGLMNAASEFDYPKVIWLTHSTHENLTRDWTNVYPIASEKTVCPGRGNNEAPACHQLHYTWEHCKKTENSIAQCLEDISFEQTYRVIWHVLKQALEKAA